MSTILDKNARPISSEQQNGHSRQGTMDVRTIPTGTLIYNLIRYTNECMGLQGALQQFDLMRQQKLVVNEPPQITKIREHLEQAEACRYLISKELNDRFAEFDKGRIASLNLEVLDLTKKPAESPSPAAEPEPKQG